MAESGFVTQPTESSEVGPAGSDSSETKQLAFRPDPVRTAVVARLRLLLLGLAVLMLVITMVILVGYRPRYSIRALAAGGDSAPAPAFVSAPLQSSKSEQVVPISDRYAAVRAALCGIDSTVALVEDRWLRTRTMLPASGQDSVGVHSVLPVVRRAAILIDSTLVDAVRLRQNLALIRTAVDRAEGNDAYNLSLVYTAAGRYVEAVIGRDAERRFHVAAIDQAFHSLAAGDVGDYDVKLDVANSYRYRADNRQRVIQRLAQQLTEAAGRLQ